MKSTHLTLICHAQTDAQRVGRFHGIDDVVRESARAQISLPSADHLLVAERWRFKAGWSEAMLDSE